MEEDGRDRDYEKNKRCIHRVQQNKPFTLLGMGVGREEAQKLIALLWG